ncbi:MAG: 3-phosphoshikimate 1-carboxyvinyltransferase [Oscillospiraceae bacterium]|jgi:3-phosphoshikimate 1-carboxyvinyltransferase|nr:3-phosphoshikimate 1-carboxyvinyltransferase [Oscillospiraceae bacterium]
MDVRITPSKLSGTITPPPSKSVSHRALICSALAGGGKIINLLDCDDITATKNALSAVRRKSAEIDCGESGSTLRFLMPVFAALGITAVFKGRGELPGRPITPYLEQLPKHGITFERTEMPYKISGGLTAGEYRVGGDVSSQFVTGLLLALPLLGGDSEIVLTSPLQSKPYADLTVAVMRDYGVVAEETARGYFIRGGQTYKPCVFTAEADMSQAAFFAVANALGSEIRINGLNPNSLQGDKAIFDIVKRPPPYEIDASDIPDLVPVLSVLCAVSPGTSLIRNCSRLRFKECDRLEAVSSVLNKIGGRVEILPDCSLKITGVKQLEGGVCPSRNDHRIAMSLSVAAARCGKPLIVKGAECVKKSYVNFFDDMEKLGGIVDVLGV